MKARKFLWEVYLNDKFVGHEVLATKQGAKNWIKVFVRDTHMGTWRKIPGGYEYATTIGKYYQFIKKDNLG